MPNRRDILERGAVQVNEDTERSSALTEKQRGGSGLGAAVLLVFFIVVAHRYADDVVLYFSS